MIFNAPRFARRSFGLLDEDGDGIYDSQRGGVGEDENIPYAPVVVSNSLMGIAVDGRESIGGGEGGGERDSFSRSLRGEGGEGEDSDDEDRRPISFRTDRDRGDGGGGGGGGGGGRGGGGGPRGPPAGRPTNRAPPIAAVTVASM